MRKSSMRKTRNTIAGAVMGLCLATGALAAGGDVKYASPEAAFEQGIGAYRSGYYEIAIPALTAAIEKGSEQDRFFATFYLARIYADNTGARTDHGAAYRLFLQLIAKFGDVDPDDGRRAPFVSKAMIALAGYLRTGLPQIDLAPDIDRANDFLQDAATIYGDRDAQFELAKAHLGTDATAEDAKLGVHYLSTLAQDGHAGAQAYLADLYWRGRFVDRNAHQALALIKMAIQSAQAQDRVWIEDIYQSIYCGSSQGVRKQADGTVAAWRKVFPRPPVSPEELAAAAHMPATERFCKGGEMVDLGSDGKGQSFGSILSAPSSAFVPPQPPVQGNTSGFGIIGAGVKN